MEEIWKDIEGFKGLYQVSNLGRVKSFKRNKETILKEQKNKKGYPLVGLYKDGEYKHYLVHRLVYKAFYGKIPYWMVINHKDENPTNNNKDNLMVCTYKENNCWGTRIERVRNKVVKPVLQFDLNGNFIKEFPSIAEVKKQLGIERANVTACCNGKLKKSGGYIWKFKEVG